MNKHKNRKYVLRRGVFILPTLCTIGTIFCGFYSITSVMRSEFDQAAIAIGIAVVFDGMDGRIARLTNSSSEFGVQIDSLADVATFGIAPALLAYYWGLGNLQAIQSFSQHLEQLGWVICFGYLVCGAMRLARFNTQSESSKSAPKYSEKRFVGMPIPAGAGLIAATVHYNPEPISCWAIGVGWMLIISFMSFLMVSTIRYPSFKYFDFKKRNRYINVAFLGLAIALIHQYSQVVLLILAVSYVSSGLVVKFISMFKTTNGSLLTPDTLDLNDE